MEQTHHTSVFHLHIEMSLKDLNRKERMILKKYGQVEKGLYRDVLVPADMTLHALHYAIMRLFGWQNCHLHHYELPPKTFAHLTEDNLSKWLHLVGVYFRFPGEDWEDLYWDDDYRGDQGLKTWLKKKYTGPYIYKGWSEHYLSSQQAVQEWISQAGQHQGSLQEQRFAFENSHLEALLERLTVSDLLIPNHQYIQTKSIQAYVRRVLNWPDVEHSLQEAGSKKFRSHKQARIYYEEHDPKPMPLAHLLHYFYDEGDGWALEISCKEVYRCQEGQWLDSRDRPISTWRNELAEVASRYRPLCIEKDGIELLDDIGGLTGFCQMLETLFDFERLDADSIEQRRELFLWAYDRGWTGNTIRLKSTL